MENEVVNTQNHEIAKYLAGQFVKILIFLAIPLSFHLRGYVDFVKVLIPIISNPMCLFGLIMIGMAILSVIDTVKNCQKIFSSEDKTAKLKEILASDDDENKK